MKFCVVKYIRGSSFIIVTRLRAVSPRKLG